MCPYINGAGTLCPLANDMPCSFFTFGCGGKGIDTPCNGSEHCGLLFWCKKEKFPKLPKKPQTYYYDKYDKR